MLENLKKSSSSESGQQPKSQVHIYACFVHFYIAALANDAHGVLYFHVWCRSARR